MKTGKTFFQYNNKWIIFKLNVSRVGARGRGMGRFKQLQSGQMLILQEISQMTVYK